MLVVRNVLETPVDVVTPRQKDKDVTRGLLRNVA